MTDEDPNAKRWVEVWKQAGPRLEELERQRLRNFRYEDHMDEIDELLELAFRFAKPRNTSGLVEQQRLFAKLRKQETR
jgi:hypothetical protein